MGVVHRLYNSGEREYNSCGVYRKWIARSKTDSYLSDSYGAKKRTSSPPGPSTHHVPRRRRVSGSPKLSTASSPFCLFGIGKRAWVLVAAISIVDEVGDSWCVGGHSRYAQAGPDSSRHGTSRVTRAFRGGRRNFRGAWFLNQADR